jgi:hypothetical protein
MLISQFKVLIDRNEEALLRAIARLRILR